MNDYPSVTRERRTWVNASDALVLYPLGSFKVEVSPGETLAYVTEEPRQDSFTRARARQKLLAKVAPTLIVLGIVVIALLIVFALSMKAASEG